MGPSPDTASGSASLAGSRFDPELGFTVPSGFVFSQPTSNAIGGHSSLVSAVPGAFSAQTTWLLRVDDISAPVSRLALTPGHRPAHPNELLKAAAASPNGADAYEAWDSYGVHVVKAHRGWIDSYAWVDPNQDAVWVLTEQMDQHQYQWPGHIATFIAAQQ
jgi:hypothetical protein